MWQLLARKRNEFSSRNGCTPSPRSKRRAPAEATPWITTGPSARARNSRWLQPRSAPEPFGHDAHVAATDGQTDQVVEGGLDPGALRVRVGLHIGHGVDDHHVLEADHHRELHGVHQAGDAAVTRPGPFVLELGDDHHVVLALVDVGRNGPPVDGILVRARRRTEGGDGQLGIRHRLIVALQWGWAPAPPG